MFKNIVVGMSGGVDSAVAALLLKNKGFNVTGVFMKNWDLINEVGECQGEKDYADAQWICDKIKIPLVQVNLVKDYWNNVFSYIIDEYKAGVTPNPDVMCNKHIKFDKFYHLVRTQFQADAVATGHYVKTSFGPYLENYKPNTNVRLLQATDPVKDQTFFLCQVPQTSLRHCMFPLGSYFKQDVKKIAADAGLSPILKKKESMGICFVGKRNFQQFISEYIDDTPGNFVDFETGTVVGQHKGLHYWTVGQRCKIPRAVKAYFIYQKNVASKEILVVGGTDHPALYSDLLLTKSCHWIGDEPTEIKNSEGVISCMFRFQHGEPLINCTVHKKENQELIIRLAVPLRAITEGQFAVLYSGEECLGGSIVSYPGPSNYLLKHSLPQEIYDNISQNNI